MLLFFKYCMYANLNQTVRKVFVHSPDFSPVQEKKKISLEISQCWDERHFTELEGFQHHGCNCTPSFRKKLQKRYMGNKHVST
mmetsp:Transcript_22621/g.25759  ORF Transcript_22621/g.25759 Transcript_22621/m.25759 type:complete len:83 (-) Transcript_22621:386-634(-)